MRIRLNQIEVDRNKFGLLNQLEFTRNYHRSPTVISKSDARKFHEKHHHHGRVDSVGSVSSLTSTTSDTHSPNTSPMASENSTINKAINFNLNIGDSTTKHVDKVIKLKSRGVSDGPSPLPLIIHPRLSLIKKTDDSISMKTESKSKSSTGSFDTGATTTSSNSDATSSIPRKETEESSSSAITTNSNSTDIWGKTMASIVNKTVATTGRSALTIAQSIAKNLAGTPLNIMDSKKTVIYEEKEFDCSEGDVDTLVEEESYSKSPISSKDVVISMDETIWEEKKMDDLDNIYNHQATETVTHPLGKRCWSFLVKALHIIRDTAIVIILLAFQFFAQHTLHFIIFTMVFNYYISPSLTTVVYPLLCFGFLMVSNPRQLPPISLRSGSKQKARTSTNSTKSDHTSNADYNSKDSTATSPKHRSNLSSNIDDLERESDSDESTDEALNNSKRFSVFLSEGVEGSDEKELQTQAISHSNSAIIHPVVQSPPKAFWKLLSLYTCAVICVKFFYQLPFICHTGIVENNVSYNISTNSTLLQEVPSRSFGGIFPIYPFCANVTEVLTCNESNEKDQVIVEDEFDTPLDTDSSGSNSINNMASESLRDECAVIPPKDGFLPQIFLKVTKPLESVSMSALLVSASDDDYQFIRENSGDFILIFLIICHVLTLKSYGLWRWQRREKKDLDQLYKIHHQDKELLLSDEIDQLKNDFASVDHNDNGKIESGDLICLLSKSAYTIDNATFQSIIHEIDINHDGYIDMDAYFSIMVPHVVFSRLGRDLTDNDVAFLREKFYTIKSIEINTDEQGLPAIPISDAINVVLSLDDSITYKLVAQYFLSDRLQLNSRGLVTWQSLSNIVKLMFNSHSKKDKIKLSKAQYFRMKMIFNSLDDERLGWLSREFISMMLQSIAVVDSRFAFRNAMVQKNIHEYEDIDQYSFHAVLHIFGCEYERAWKYELPLFAGICRCSFFMAPIKILLLKIRDLITKLYSFLVVLFTELFDLFFPSREKPGANFYGIQFGLMLTSLFSVALFSSKNSPDNSSYLSSGFIQELAYYFTIIVLDRIFYLLKAIRCKTLMHYALLGFTLGDHIRRSFLGIFDSPYNHVIFIIDCLYFLVSSLQIGYGYPKLTSIKFFSNNVHFVIGIVYTIILMIPFLYELRVILDWTFTSTTLYLSEWIQFEDISISLYLTACKFDYRVREGRHKGKKQPLYRKCLVGALIFIGLVLFLWMPLYSFSSWNPSNSSNPVTSASISIGITGFPNFYEINKPAKISPLLPASDSGNCQVDKPLSWECAKRAFPVLNYLSYSQDEAYRNELQFIELQSSSGLLWDITPPTRNELISLLKNDTDTGEENSVDVEMTVEFVFKRLEGSNSGKLMPGRYSLEYYFHSINKRKIGITRCFE
jgi:hypothetical protein